MKHLLYLPFFATLFLVTSCDIKKSNIAPEASFVRVYDSRNISESYFPQDITQLSSGNYLILSALRDSSLINYPKVSIVATGSSGEAIAQIVLPQSYSNPVPGWLKFGNETYFICMDDVTYQAKLIQVKLEGETINWEEVRSFERDKPVYAWNDDNSMVMLSFSYGSDESYINKYDNNFNDQWESKLGGNGDGIYVEEKIDDHLQKIGDHQPFFIRTQESTSGTQDFIVNCVTRETMMMVFVNGASGQIAGGRVTSYLLESGLTAALNLEGDTFALARQHSGNCFISSKIGLNKEEVVTTRDLNTVAISEFRFDAPMDIFLYDHGEKTYIVFASTTGKDQIMLLFFDKETGELVYTHPLGEGNPVEVSSIKITDDGGLAILGNTKFYDKYQRIIFYKLDPDQLKIED